MPKMKETKIPKAKEYKWEPGDFPIYPQHEQDEARKKAIKNRYDFIKSQKNRPKKKKM